MWTAACPGQRRSPCGTRMWRRCGRPALPWTRSCWLPHLHHAEGGRQDRYEPCATTILPLHGRAARIQWMTCRVLCTLLASRELCMSHTCNGRTRFESCLLLSAHSQRCAPVRVLFLAGLPRDICPTMHGRGRDERCTAQLGAHVFYPPAHGPGGALTCQHVIDVSQWAMPAGYGRLSRASSGSSKHGPKVLCMACRVHVRHPGHSHKEERPHALPASSAPTPSSSPCRPPTS